MSERPRVSRRTALVVVALGGVAAAVLVAVWMWPDNRSRAVPVDEAVSNFRASTIPDDISTTTASPTTAAASTPSETSASSTTLPSTPDNGTGDDPSASTDDGTGEARPEIALPEPGVYRYATSGWEDIDALNGARHDYPAETTITVTTEGCGVRLRWDALRERREEWRLCPTELGVELQPDAIQYHEFFQQPDLEHLECDRGVVVVPVEAAAPNPVVQSCLLEEDPWVATWSVIERSTRTVGATEVAVWHVRMTVDDDDEHWEQTTIDWFLDDRGLPIAATSSKESVSPSPIGDVRYRESYELSAVSLTPLR